MRKNLMIRTTLTIIFFIILMVPKASIFNILFDKFEILDHFIIKGLIYLFLAFLTADIIFRRIIRPFIDEEGEISSVDNNEEVQVFTKYEIIGVIIVVIPYVVVFFFLLSNDDLIRNNYLTPPHFDSWYDRSYVYIFLPTPLIFVGVLIHRIIEKLTKKKLKRL